VYERGGGRDLPSRDAPRMLATDLVALAKRLGRERDPGVRQLIARAHTNDYVFEQLGRRIGALLRKGDGADAGIAAYGKLAHGIFLAQRARIGMEIGRAGALVWEPGNIEGQTAALNYLNGRVMAIAGGTNEMQRNGIGERVLGLPREPSFDTDIPFREVARRAQEWTGKAPGKG
jgi:alkylation response protein AidB-like acyl-CoA dehydrogenase